MPVEASKQRVRSVYIDCMIASLSGATVFIMLLYDSALEPT